MDFLRAAIASSKQKSGKSAVVAAAAAPAAAAGAAAGSKRKADSTGSAPDAPLEQEQQPKKFKSRGELEAERVAKLAKEKVRSGRGQSKQHERHDGRPTSDSTSRAHTHCCCCCCATRVFV